MALVAAWELIATDDLGPGSDEGTRRTRITTVCETPDGTMRLVQAKADLTPEQVERWKASMAGKRVEQ